MSGVGDCGDHPDIIPVRCPSAEFGWALPLRYLGCLLFKILVVQILLATCRCVERTTASENTAADCWFVRANPATLSSRGSLVFFHPSSDFRTCYEFLATWHAFGSFVTFRVFGRRFVVAAHRRDRWQILSSQSQIFKSMIRRQCRLPFRWSRAIWPLREVPRNGSKWQWMAVIGHFLRCYRHFRPNRYSPGDDEFWQRVRGQTQTAMLRRPGLSVITCIVMRSVCELVQNQK